MIDIIGHYQFCIVFSSANYPQINVLISLFLWDFWLISDGQWNSITMNVMNDDRFNFVLASESPNPIPQMFHLIANITTHPNTFFVLPLITALSHIFFINMIFLQMWNFFILCLYLIFHVLTSLLNYLIFGCKIYFHLSN